MISTKGRYALRVMIDIATYSDGQYITLKEISSRQDISVKYLEQIIALLNHAGLLQSLRGTGGGYRLAKPASEYTAGEILRAAEGTLAPIACLQSEPNTCERADRCTTFPFWREFYRVINEYTESVTLQKLVDDAKAMAGYDFSI